MPLLGVTLTATGALRLEARPPQLALSDVEGARELEPGRPVRLLDGKGGLRAIGAADPENELLRVWSHGDDARAPDAPFVRARVAAALELRRTLGLADGESAYRLFNGEGDGMSGLAVDVYGRFAVVTTLSRGLLGYARLLAQSALEVLPAAGLPLVGVVLKTRLKGTGNSPERAKDDIVGETPPAKLIVRESGVPYEVHLGGGINVGLFTDMREHRAGLARFVRGQRVLNTFAYTGALSVAAARAGASAVTSVDLAAGPLAWARANFALSGLDAAAPAYRWEVSDVFRFLEAERERRATYDVIILDPPTVSGARASLWAQKRDYPDLIAAACALLPDAGGHLWISSNTHRGPSVLKHVDAGLTLAGREAQILELGGLPPDYPTPLAWPAARYLEVCQVRVGVRVDARVGESRQGPVASRIADPSRTLGPAAMRVLLVTPPMTQLNTPYPATAYLMGCLRKHAAPSVVVSQADLSLELFLRLFSHRGLTEVRAALEAAASARPGRRSRASRGRTAHAASADLGWFLSRWETYADLVEPVVRFLQGHDASLAMRIAGRAFLPEGPRFAALDQQGDQHDGDGDDLLGWAFGQLGVTDRARHLASLFVDDLADVIRDGVDPRFELSRYGEKLAASATRFDALSDALDAPPTLVDRLLDDVARECLRTHAPDVVGLTVPFPGNLYGALRIARIAKREHPAAKVVLGGGYVNTELRQLGDGRVFDACDYMTLDDGERPFLALLEHLGDPSRPLFRTYVREAGAVVLKSTPTLADLHHRDTGTPTYEGLPLDRYVSLFEMLNPMHRLWADGRWNKLTVARGCYWKQCTFCDVSLDYIARYEPASADVTVDRIVALVRETGETGFHFVDEAAPPAMLRALAQRLLERRVAITWWGNIRFEKAFTPDLVQLLARSGCVAISGGLEVASDRLLALMKKGVTVEQVARVTRAFTDAGVMVHAYLMYGFPTETAAETVDALERVRQLFAEGCIQSAFWHRFAATAHSPIGLDPKVYGIRLARQPAVAAGDLFARNELPFVDPTGCDHELFGPGLRRALYNFMHGIGLDVDVRTWFAPEAKSRAAIPKAKVPADLIRRALAGADDPGDDGDAGERPSRPTRQATRR